MTALRLRCTDHIYTSACWRCSDAVSWWRDLRGGADPPNLPPAGPPTYERHCIALGCEGRGTLRGMCPTHYKRWYDDLKGAWVKAQPGRERYEFRLSMARAADSWGHE